MKKVIFACIHGAGRSQMAAAFFNSLVAPGRAQAFAAGTEPAARVHPEVVTAMKEAGIDLSSAKPRLLTAELASGAAILVTLGCGEQCPVVPGAEREDWPLPDPKGLPRAEVESVRDAIRDRVEAMLDRNGWRR
jgi:arsenate reductase